MEHSQVLPRTTTTTTPPTAMRGAQVADLCFPLIFPAGSPNHFPPALGEPRPLKSEKKPPEVTKIRSFIHVILLDFKDKNTVVLKTKVRNTPSPHPSPLTMVNPYICIHGKLKYTTGLTHRKAANLAESGSPCPAVRSAEPLPRPRASTSISFTLLYHPALSSFPKAT